MDSKEKPNPVIIAEFCQNRTLYDIIKLEKRSHSPPAWNDTKKLINLYEIASVMSFLHENDYIHRDLKPDNIFEDEYLYPRIGDFGLGKHINKEKCSTQNIEGQTDYLKKYGIEFERHFEVFVSKPYKIGVHRGVIENVKCWFIHHFELFSKPYPQGSNS